jgi:hypothetical protein
LLGGQIRGSPSAKVYELGLATGYVGRVRIGLKFSEGGCKVSPDFFGVLIGVHAKIAKVTTLPTKRNMVIKPKRSVSGRWALHDALQAGHVLLVPKGKRRIVRNEIVSNLGLILGLVVGFDESFLAHA